MKFHDVAILNSGMSFFVGVKKNRIGQGQREKSFIIEEDIGLAREKVSTKRKDGIGGERVNKLEFIPRINAPESFPYRSRRYIQCI